MRKLLITMALASATAMAADVQVSDCIIQEVLPGKHMTAAFATFDNKGDQPVILKKAAVDSISDHVELHEMVHHDGVMKMQQIMEYQLEPGETFFKKGGYHVMILDIEKAPEIGSEHNITFTFADGQTAQCEAKVLSVDDVMKHFDQDKDMAHQMQEDSDKK